MEDTNDWLFSIVFIDSVLSEYRFLLLIVLAQMLASKRRKSSFSQIRTKENNSNLTNTPTIILLCMAVS